MQMTLNTNDQLAKSINDVALIDQVGVVGAFRVLICPRVDYRGGRQGHQLQG